MRRFLLLVALCVPTTASAHFQLDSPPSAYEQMAPNGDPQKTAPCGGSTSATTAVTNVQPGGMLRLTVKETIDHAGWYRVSIAQTEGQLPVMPPLASCNQLQKVATPTLPMLADGLFEHTASFNKVPQTAQIKLPDGYECNNCVVQVVEHMSAAAAPGCYYYHCAKVNISASVPPTPDPGVGNPAGGDAGTTGPSETTGGCSTTGRDASPLLILFALFAFRTRRSAAAS